MRHSTTDPTTTTNSTTNPTTTTTTNSTTNPTTISTTNPTTNSTTISTTTPTTISTTTPTTTHITPTHPHSKFIALIPNSLTLFRVLASILLIFIEPMSIGFISIYLAIGLSDVLDGALARKLCCATKQGAIFDGFADALFILVCLVIFIPYFELPVIFWIWCGCVAAVKIAALLMNYRRSGYFGFKSSVENKIAGVVLFLAPVCAFALDVFVGGVSIGGVFVDGVSVGSVFVEGILGGVFVDGVSVVMIIVGIVVTIAAIIDCIHAR